MPSIQFAEDASSAFADLIQHFKGYNVEVTTEEHEVFDAFVLGSAVDEDPEGWYTAIRVQRLDPYFEPEDEIFVVRAESIKVY